MNKHFNVNETAAGAGNSRAMEADTILKTREIPKSHKSRFFLSIFGMLLLSFFTFTNNAMGQVWDISTLTGWGDVTATLSGDTLIISGRGFMADFYDSPPYRPPWWNQRLQIHTVIFEEIVSFEGSVRNVGDGAFDDCTNLTSVTLSHYVQRIGVTSFMNCTKLNNITLSACLFEIKGGAFHGCYDLTVNCRMTEYPDIIYQSDYEYGNEYPFNDIKKLCVMPWLINVYDYPSGKYTKEILYDEVLATPTNEEQKINGTINEFPIPNLPCKNCYVYKVSLTEGIKYTFCASNGSIFSTETDLYDNSGNKLFTWIDGCGDPYQSTFTGDAYVVVHCDGTFTLTYRCYTEGIDEVKSNKINVYPNPTKDEIAIESEFPINKVEIYSLIGTLLISESNFKEKISVSTLFQGVYLLKVYTDKGLTIRKLVKN